MVIKKFTEGYVEQVFDTTTNQLVSQRFVAGDDVTFEDEKGKPIKPNVEVYAPFTMEQEVDK